MDKLLCKEAYDMLREIHNDKLQKNKMRSLKVVASVALISTLTITTTFAVEYIIDYFNQNKQSLYLSDKNDFEKTVFEKQPEIGYIKDNLYKLGAKYASMSGSGSSVYGIFAEKPHFENYFEGYFTACGLLD